jgi:hypothetical protein
MSFHNIHPSTILVSPYFSPGAILLLLDKTKLLTHLRQSIQTLQDTIDPNKLVFFSLFVGMVLKPKSPGVK